TGGAPPVSPWSPPSPFEAPPLGAPPSPPVPVPPPDRLPPLLVSPPLERLPPLLVSPPSPQESSVQSPGSQPGATSAALRRPSVQTRRLGRSKRRRRERKEGIQAVIRSVS